MHSTERIRKELIEFVAKMSDNGKAPADAVGMIDALAHRAPNPPTGVEDARRLGWHVQMLRRAVEDQDADGIEARLDSLDVIAAHEPAPSGVDPADVERVHRMIEAMEAVDWTHEDAKGDAAVLRRLLSALEPSSERGRVDESDDDCECIPGNAEWNAECPVHGTASMPSSEEEGA